MYEDPRVLDWPHPDPLDVVMDLAGMMATVAAERLQRIDELRLAHLADAEVAGRVLTDVVMRGLRLELAAAMRITEYAAGNLIALAEALVQRYPEVMTAFSDARITERHAEMLVDGLDELEPDLQGDLLGEALALAESQPVGEFRRSLRKLIENARVVTLAERHEAALTHRRVHVEPVGDGMAWTHHLGPEVEATAAYGRATAIAKTILAQEGETRSLDQIRADVMADLLIEGTTTRASHRSARHPCHRRRDRAGSFAARRRPMRRWRRREQARRQWKVSDRSRSAGRANCAEATQCGCGCSRIPRRAWCSRSDAPSTRLRRR